MSHIKTSSNMNSWITIKLFLLLLCYCLHFYLSARKLYFLHCISYAVLKLDFLGISPVGPIRISFYLRFILLLSLFIIFQIFLCAVTSKATCGLISHQNCPHGATKNLWGSNQHDILQHSWHTVSLSALSQIFSNLCCRSTLTGSRR